MARQSDQNLDVLGFLELGGCLVHLYQLIFDRLEFLGHAGHSTQLGVSPIGVGPERLGGHDSGQLINLALQLKVQLFASRADRLASLLNVCEGGIRRGHVVSKVVNTTTVYGRGEGDGFGLLGICPRYRVQQVLRNTSGRILQCASMNRSELVEKLAERMTQLYVRDAQAGVDAILSAITVTLAKGGRVEIRGFGAFTTSQLAPRIGRNPRTGERVGVPGKRTARFKPGGDLKAGVNRVKS